MLWNVTLLLKVIKVLEDVVGFGQMALIGTDSLALALEFADWLRLPYGDITFGAMTSVTF